MTGGHIERIADFFNTNKKKVKKMATRDGGIKDEREFSKSRCFLKPILANKKMTGGHFFIATFTGISVCVCLKYIFLNG